MPEQAVLTEAGYRKLVRDLREILEGGKRRAAQAASQILIETAWELGKRISEEGLTDQASYGDSILEDLAEGLGMSTEGLRRAVIFFRQNKISSPRRGNLTWAHYQELIFLTDAKEREFYAKLAESEALTRGELRAAIKKDAYGTESKSPRKAGTRVEFVRDRLARARGVVIQTTKVDIYGRYLNQELVVFHIPDVPKRTSGMWHSMWHSRCQAGVTAWHP